MTMNDEYNLITIHFGSYESVAASAIGALWASSSLSLYLASRRYSGGDFLSSFYFNVLNLEFASLFWYSFKYE